MRLFLFILSTVSLTASEFLNLHSNQSTSWYADWKATSDTNAEPSLKLSFLNQSASEVHLAPWSPFPDGILRFQFHTLYAPLPILSLYTPQLHIRCYIDQQGLLIANVHSCNHELFHQVILSDAQVNTNSWVTLTLRSHPRGLKLKVLSGTHVQSAILPANISTEERLYPVLGEGGFIGCMRGVKISNHTPGPLIRSSPVSSRGVVIGRNCVDRCENVSCGLGACVNAWSRHICDCSATLHAGDACSRDAPKLGISDDQSALFHLSAHRIHSLSFWFQSLTPKGQILNIHSSHSYISTRVQGAVLNYESAVFQLISHFSHLEVLVEIGNRLFFRNISGIGLSGPTEDNWNLVEVQFRSHSHIHVTVNGAGASLTTENWEWYADRVEVGKGLISCLSQLILNKFQVLSEGEVLGVSKDSCPTHRSLAVYIPFSTTRIQGLHAQDIYIGTNTLIFQLEFLLSHVSLEERGLLLLVLPNLSTSMRVYVREDKVMMTSSLGNIPSYLQVGDKAWHKLELKLRTADGRMRVLLSVDGYSESAVFPADLSDGNFLIGQLRLGHDNRTSIGGCVRNVALFGTGLSVSSLLTGSELEESADFCPISTQCDFSPCANGATCQTGTNTFPVCHCAPQFSGKFCTNSTISHLLPANFLSYLLPIIIIATITAVGMCIGIICATVRKSGRSTGMYRTREETGISIVQESNYSINDTFLPAPRPALEWPV